MVPTAYSKLSGPPPRTIRSAQFSVTEHPKPVDALSGRTLPGAFFFYDLSPIAVTFTEARPPLVSFVTNVCAILGGVFTVSGLLDAGIYHGGRLIKRKQEMGKFS